MKVEFINPFVISTLNTFQTMLNERPERLQPYLGDESGPSHEVSALIGMSGQKAQGSVIFSLSRVNALKAVSRFLGEEIKVFDKQVADGVGELVNIIAGGAKMELGKMGYRMEISLPNVVVGKEHKVWSKSGVPRIVIPFKSVVGDFTVEFSLKTE